MADIDTGSSPFLRRSYELTGADDAAALYDEWAETYEADTGESMGYVGPAVAAARLAELAPSGVVLDAGAGTGLVGVSWPGAAPTPVADDADDAVVCVGTLTEGHVGPEALAEFVRVTRVGGLVVATILDPIWEPKGYRAAVEALAEAGRAELREADEHPYRTRQNVTCRVVVLDVR